MGQEQSRSKHRCRGAKEPEQGDKQRARAAEPKQMKGRGAGAALRGNQARTAEQKQSRSIAPKAEGP